ncbi:TOBE domain-containing protein [Halocatena halophila]|uniref:TOBE domain-containing protein n=1 Tax=Halocatena halophila TaxID=2814576 RepID=UPI002ED2674D
MEHEVAIDTALRAGDVQFTERDATLLRAIAAEGSLSGGATALGRSYARSQRRIVELESAFGSLVERTRGGADGGHSTLTQTATRLCGTFDRLDSELQAQTNVDATVLDGVVRESVGDLGTVDTAVGVVRAVAPSVGKSVRVVIRADTVTLFEPGSVPATATSARNRFSGTVTTIDDRETAVRVGLAIGTDTELIALITPESADRLAIESGTELVSSFKATATRAFSTFE